MLEGILACIKLHVSSPLERYEQDSLCTGFPGAELDLAQYNPD